MPGRPASPGRGMVGRWVRWEPLADNNQTEALQKLRHTHRVLSGEEEAENNQASQEELDFFIIVRAIKDVPFWSVTIGHTRV